jgi:membrane fusion protein, multidrug efflux system
MSETLRKFPDTQSELPATPPRQERGRELPLRSEAPLPARKRFHSLRASLYAALALIATIAAVVFGVHWWLEHRYIESTDNAYLQADSVTVAPRIEGLVHELLVEENVAVEKGDILLTIDDRDYRARVGQARAVVGARRAQVLGDRATIDSLDAQIAQQQSVISQMEANLTVAKTEVERSKLDFKRYEHLVASNIASKQRFETASSDYKKAMAEEAGVKAKVEAEERRLPVIKTNRRQAEAKLEQSKADLAEAEAALELARIRLQDTVIRAPVTGVVTNRSARVGQYVRPGSALMAVVPREPYITANFKETQLTTMRPGQKVDISIDAYPDLHLEGLIETMSPATGAQFSLLPPENATGNFTKIVQRVPVRIRILAEPLVLTRLSAGLSAVVSVDTAPAKGKPAPADASKTAAGGMRAVSGEARAAPVR